MNVCNALLCSLVLFLSATPAVADPGNTEKADARTAEHLLRQLESYADALVRRDTGAAAALMSQRKQARIQRRHPTGALLRFVDQDRANLIEALGGEVDSVRGRFSVLKLEALPEALFLHAAFDGRPLAKPLAFVLENGQYRFDGGNAQLSGDTYKIENQSPWSQILHCIYNNQSEVFPHATQKMWCVDEEYVCDGTGTLFTYQDRLHYCDWNTWGSDFFINFDGSGQCNDRC